MFSKQLVTDDESLKEILATAPEKSNKLVVLDCESYGGEDTWYTDAFCVQVLLPSAGEYYHLNMHDYGDGAACTRELVRDLLYTWLSPEATMVCHNFSADGRWLRRMGVEIRSTVWDTRAGALLHKNIWKHLPKGLSLQNVGRLMSLGGKDDKVDEWLKTAKMTRKWHMQEVPLSLMYDYGYRDVVLTYEIYKKQAAWLPKQCKEEWEVECLLAPILLDIRTRGMRVDKEFCDTFAKETEDTVWGLKKELDLYLGGSFVDSYKHIQTFVHDFMPNYTMETTKTGLPKTSDDYIKELIKMDEDLGEVLGVLRRYREANKTYSTFIKAFKGKEYIHGKLDNSGTLTGRFSSSSPNLQNLPSEGKVRACLIKEMAVGAAIDFSQMEYGVSADEAGDTGLISKINAGHDVHQVTADDLGMQRDLAKKGNFAVLYGMGPPAFALLAGITEAEATDFFRKLRISQPKLFLLRDRLAAHYKLKGLIVTRYNRILFCPVPTKDKFGRIKTSEYKALNHYIQSTCASVVKRGMVRIAQRFDPNTELRILSQIHDELWLEAASMEHIMEAKKILEESYNPLNGLNLRCGLTITERGFSKDELKEVAA